MEDTEIIRLLFDRNEAALQEIAQRYGRLYTSVLRNILAEEGDVEECANDVLTSTWNSIPPNRPQTLAPFLCTLAKRIGIDRVRYNTRTKRNPGFTVQLSELEDCLSEEEPAAQESNDGKEIREALNRFLREQDPESRILFVRRYVYDESVTSLAKRFGRKENTVSAILSRTRKKLKDYLQKEGIQL